MSRLSESIGKPLQVRSNKELTGPFTVLGVFNQNERRYPDDVYMEAYQELIPKIQERRLMGELDHPLDYDEVRLANVSHIIKECTIKESNGKKVVYGTVELLDTPSGKIAQALVEAGIPLGISSRAVGNTKQVPGGVDVTQLKLITYDLVAEPSFKTAILSEKKKSALAESLNFIESRLPLNESEGESTNIRNSINKIRESLCLNETKSSAEIHINQVDFKTLEINALKSLLESKVSQIKSDTSILMRSRGKIKSLESKLVESKERYDNLLKNHNKLQEAFNTQKSNQKLSESKKIAELTDTIVELRKRLAVEQRGMSYDKVSNLLEGVRTERDINSKLDNISSLNKRSSSVSISDTVSLVESTKIDKSRSVLSSIISKV